MQSNQSALNRIFKLSDKNTSVGKEVVAGFTTFMTMAYILAVNPIILSGTGMDAGALFTATALAAIIGTLAMGLMANLPFALASGMGLNAIFAYYICGALGYSWQTALTAVFLEGIIFIILTFFNVREAIINAIPLPLKYAITTGIGLFIALIGFVNSGIIIRGEGTVLDMGSLSSPPVIIALIGIVFTGILLANNVKGAILIGMIVTSLLGVFTGQVVFPENWSPLQVPPSIAPIAFQLDFTHIFSTEILSVLFILLFIDMFDTVGTLIGVCERSGMLDEEGKVPNAKMALMADAIGTTVGALLGTSTVTTYVESAAGVAEGGRTGLTSVVTALLFALALLFSPIFLLVPAFATGPALVIVGMMMMTSIAKIDWNDYSVALPAFLTMILMPLSYSIADGIMFGVISYVVIKVFIGKIKEIPALTFVIAILSIINILLTVVQM